MISCHPIFDLSYIWCHTGAYFRFDWDLRIFMELHAHPHLRDTHWHDVSSVEPLRSYPVRAALRDASMSSCFPSRGRPFDLWVWFSCTRGWLGSRIRWRVIWAHLVLLTYHAFDAILGHTPIPQFVRSFADSLTTQSTSWSSWVIIPGHSSFIAFPTGSYTPLFGFAMSCADFMITKPTCRSLYVIT